ncbi:MAG: CBS domain-containing protein [Rhodocyclaceae bacterium]|nr:CBS domain-containing protein [Rhodocyclaceae bacterium]MCP5232931.1 CBS domain-containing protein [Zoogloeaceae bacterium]MCP5241657.1 CBS domain-containing protein [Zoogloeaceae bacterium]MCP5255012.1 CBS domain-containing protein [Zoogloeaceae bacterium]MCP5295469.1 CBS domain-containing protein [Zoogloeaceae bacterium]
MSTSVGQILERKGNKVFCTQPDTSVLDALGMMAENDVGAILVTEGSRLVGIFTERDYARKVVLHGRSSRDSKISELMTSNVLTVSPSQTLDSVMQMMTENRIRHLPVVDHGALVGIVTIGDAVKAVMAEQAATINHLASYISGDLAP